MNLGELRRRFPTDIVVIVGSALSIAQLMISTGLSERMGDMFIEMFNGWGVFGALVATYLVTLLLTELVTNNAAAALAFPIGYSMSVAYGVDPMPFIMAVLFGASASFVSLTGIKPTYWCIALETINLKITCGLAFLSLSFTRYWCWP
ncbi:sulfate permease [Vibrio variabilis]|uniref:Sulfate permease n=1 Tax=Vibrio variabilis TaxID=990271 RepID=A0ABQ0JF94_9VIBR|nr:sulfate permease [Vibrio variabilis]